MLGKKMVSLRKLAKIMNKATKGTCTDSRSSREPYKYHHRESLLLGSGDVDGGDLSDDEEEKHAGENSSLRKTRTGFVAVYVGEERRRFVVPTAYLSHPLFRMLLDKARDEFGFDHRAGLAVPVTVDAFREVIAAVESSNGGFDFRAIVDEFL